MPRVINKRTEGVPEGAVLVDRSTKWGNPFKFPTKFYPTRKDVIEAYRLHITVGEGKHLPIEELRGKDLVCWCYPLPCHADILLEIANRKILKRGKDGTS